MKRLEVLGNMTAALFDLDGVVLDTEGQYSMIWEELFTEFADGHTEYALTMKGMTLVQIFEKYFSGPKEPLRQVVKQRMEEFEGRMSYPYIPGVVEFIEGLRRKGVKTAIVTSSDQAKMKNVYAAHLELKTLFDEILTAEDFSASKPDPDCYLKAAQRLGVCPDECVVFEDSFNGIKAGVAAKMRVVGLSTTNPAEAIAPLCDVVIPDFRAC